MYTVICAISSISTSEYDLELSCKPYLSSIPGNATSNFEVTTASVACHAPSNESSVIASSVVSSIAVVSSTVP